MAPPLTSCKTPSTSSGAIQACCKSQGDYLIFSLHFRITLRMIMGRGCKEIKKMQIKHKVGLALMLMLGLSLMLSINANLQSKAENKDLTKAVFKVA